MSTTNSVGSGQTTEGKQADFRSFIALHVGIVDRITWVRDRQRTSPYTYIDTNAGPGIYEGLTGSPLHFLDAIEKTSMPYQAIFIEREKDNAIELTRLVNQRRLRYPPEILNVCNQTALLDYVKDNHPPTYGMLYHDPNGVPSFDLLAEVSQSPSFRIMDFMISLPANAIKRVRGAEKASNGYTDTKRFNDSIKLINKTTWIIRRPQGKWQWTFIIGSNWPKFPDWGKRGFYRLDSEDGQAILHNLTYTDEERDAMSGQISFFDLPELQTHRIEIIRNI